MVNSSRAMTKPPQRKYMLGQLSSRYQRFFLPKKPVKGFSASKPRPKSPQNTHEFTEIMGNTLVFLFRATSAIANLSPLSHHLFSQQYPGISASNNIVLSHHSFMSTIISSLSTFEPHGLSMQQTVANLVENA